ncbi:unnamed protein product [Closterium sp. NIES-53]
MCPVSWYPAARPLVSPCSGDYGADMTVERLMDFHRRRLQVLAAAGPDIIAMETIPCHIEAQALVQLLEEQAASGAAAVPAWISFNSKDGRTAPSGDLFSSCIATAAASPHVVAVGINCTPPRFILPLLHAARKETSKPLVVYPNSGEAWDGINKEWVPCSGLSDDGFVSYAPEWVSAGAAVLGGCCRTTPHTIFSIAECIHCRGEKGAGWKRVGPIVVRTDTELLHIRLSARLDAFVPLLSVHRRKAAMGASIEAVNDEQPPLSREQGSLREHQVMVPHASIKDELKETFAPVKQLMVIDSDPFKTYRGKTAAQRAKMALFYVFPILEWVSNYKLSNLFGDVVAGLTIASLAVPQDLGYAKLAKLPLINGLYSSFVPPLIYAVLGTSRHIAIGPVAVVSLLLGDLLTKYYDSENQSAQYLNLAITSTFFAGIYQLAMGIFRLGFVIDFMSHAVIVGFMAGAAVTIALQQLRGLLGYTSFTQETDIVSVLEYVFQNTDQFNWRAFLIGMSMLTFLLTLRFLAHHFKGRKVVGKVFFYLNCVGPMTAVIVSTLAVWLTNAPVPKVGKMQKGLAGLGSLGNLQLSGQDAADAAVVGLIAGLVALTEASAIARTFAALQGYHVDGNKEMIALGAMNIAGSFTSSYVTTGSFSRSAVNYNAGGATMLTNIVMSFVVMITLLWVTPAFQYLPNATLAAIIINAVLGLLDYEAIWKIWKADKVDFIVALGTFLGILFDSVETGLLVGVCLSMLKILVQITRPHLATLGLVPGTGVYRNIQQYLQAEVTEGVFVLRVDGPLYFPNANYVREKVLSLADAYRDDHNGDSITHFVLDFTPVADIDTTGTHALQELHGLLSKQGVQLGISNPSRMVLRKLVASGFLEVLGEEWLFLSAHEAVKSCRTFRLSIKDV